MILFRQMASIVYDGGFTEFEKYLDWNAELAWKNRRMIDGLCGSNLASVPTATSDLASPPSANGPQLAFYTHLDLGSDFGVSKAQLLAKIQEAKAIGSSGYSPQSFEALQEEIAKTEAIYGDEYAPSRRVASSVSKLNTAISRMRVVNAPPPLSLVGVDSATFELENGVFTDSVSVASAIAGYSGTGYASGFTTAAKSKYKEKVSFDVEADVPESYNISLRAAVYLKDEAFRKPRTYSATSGYGHQIDVTDGERDSYWPVANVSVSNPQWLQIDLQKPVEINMVRIRIRNNQASRNMDFSLWGGTDKNNLVQLKASQRYAFTRAGSSSSTYNDSGNYADVVFDPTVVRYLRAVFTYSSSSVEVAEFEAYAPVRTAALYIDGAKAKDIVMPVNDQKLTGASWESGVIRWQEIVISGVDIPAGIHEVAIVSEGNTPDKYSLDKIEIYKEQPEYPVTIEAGPNGSIVAGESGNYKEGAEIEIEAAGEFGYKFTNWTSTDGEFADDVSAATVFTVPSGGAAITAHFAKVPISSIAIDALALTTVVRGVTYKFDAIINPDALPDGIVWTVSNPAYAIANADGSITVLNRTGTVAITATAPSGVSHNIILRIL